MPRTAVDGWMEPTPEKRRAMQRQRERDTGPEMAVRPELHRRGLRIPSLSGHLTG